MTSLLKEKDFKNTSLYLAQDNDTKKSNFSIKIQKNQAKFFSNTILSQEDFNYVSQHLANVFSLLSIGRDNMFRAIKHLNQTPKFYTDIIAKHINQHNIVYRMLIQSLNNLDEKKTLKNYLENASLDKPAQNELIEYIFNK